MKFPFPNRKRFPDGSKAESLKTSAELRRSPYFKGGWDMINLYATCWGSAKLSRLLALALADFDVRKKGSSTQVWCCKNCKQFHWKRTADPLRLMLAETKSGVPRRMRA